MISVVVPAYNEEAVIGKFLDVIVRDIPGDGSYEIVIVNDGSRDNTAPIVRGFSAKYPWIRLVEHEVNRGLGKALETGFAAARGDIIVTMDSDLPHPPAMIKDLAAQLKDVDICLALRHVPGGGMDEVPGWRIAISVMANLFFNLIFATRIRDLSSGFKAYRAGYVKKAPIHSSGFECQLEIMLYFIKNRLRYREIPLMLRNRQFGESKFRVVRMGLKYFKSLGGFLAYRWG